MESFVFIFSMFMIFYWRCSTNFTVCSFFYSFKRIFYLCRNKRACFFMKSCKFFILGFWGKQISTDGLNIVEFWFEEYLIGMFIWLAWGFSSILEGWKNDCGVYLLLGSSESALSSESRSLTGKYSLLLVLALLIKIL